MKIQEISFDMAAPAGRLDIIKYLLSNGRYGKLFVSKARAYKRFPTPPQHINCRGVTRTMIVKLDAAPKRVPFDLDRALAGDALVTRNGGDASEFKVNTRSSYPYSARVHIFEHDFLEDGSFLPSLQHPLDLFMKCELSSNAGECNE